MSETNNANFSLLVVHDNFQESMREDEDIDLKFYLASYEELDKFFALMGSVFGFVSSDLKSKVDILYNLLEKDNENFRTTKKMIDYEKSNDLLNKHGYVSGSRTLLRLHRGLDFIRLFLQYVADLKNEENTGHVCRTAYNETLAKHHSYLVATGAKLAMYTMPTKEELLRRICRDDEEHLKNALDALPKTLQVMSAVFEVIDNLYTVHNLHKLP